MRRIVFTGSIATGKSTLAKRLAARLRYPLYDADRIVHEILDRDVYVKRQLKETFPLYAKEIFIDVHTINKKRLAELVFQNPEKLRKLEALLHPVVQKFLERAFAQAQRQRRRGIICEVPLLFEAGHPDDYDVKILVTAPPFLQRQRVRARNGMKEAQLHTIRQRFLPVHHKKTRSNIVVNTGQSLRLSLKRILRILPSNYP